MGPITNPLATIISNIKDALGPYLGQQPIAASRLTHSPIYQGSENSQNLGTTLPTLGGGSRIMMSPEADPNTDLGQTILKHEIIHALIRKHGIDTDKLSYQDPEGYHFKDSLSSGELIPYALVGGANPPAADIKSAMENYIINDKSLPEGFKNDLYTLGALSKKGK